MHMRTTTISIGVVPQTLRLLDGEFVIEAFVSSSADQSALVMTHAPDGSTQVRTAQPTDSEKWVAFFSGDTAHDLDTPGMTVSVVAPLSAAGCAVFVASTATADIVLVPTAARERAIGALRDAGHTVTTT